MTTIVRSVQTCTACPSQWDAWTDTGQYLYLRYRGGHGTADAYPNKDSDQWTRVPSGETARFTHGDNLDGEISLPEFCFLAGLTLDLNGEHQ